MGSTMVVRILVLCSLAVMMPWSLAQDGAPCWESLVPCLEAAKAKDYESAAVEKCCPDLTDVVQTQLPCFCTGLSDLMSQGAVADSIFNGMLGTCKIKGTMKSLCFDKSPSTSSGGSTPSTPSGTPSTPGSAGMTPVGNPSSTGTPSTPAASTSSSSTSLKIATKSISGLFMILMPLVIC